MRNVLAALAAAFLIAMAGCSETPQAVAGDDHDHGDHDHGDQDGGHAGGQGTGDGGHANATVLVAILGASLHNGTAPLAVDFNVSAQGASANATWILDFGNGNATNGSVLPASANHTFGAGNFTVILTITDGPGTASAEAAIGVSAAADAPAPTLPATTQWVLGPAGPCVHDLATLGGGPTTPCAGLVAGPDAPAPTDGHWIALGPEYVGLMLVSTIDRGDGHGSSDADWPLYDSDCWFVAADGETQTGNGHNGGGACAGIVPEGTAYVFVSPYLLPAVEIIVDIVLPMDEAAP